MTEITAAMVKELRESTGAGMMDCKNALSETQGDFDKAVQLLREKGLGKAAKKADRLAAEGLVSVKISDDFTSATVSEINSETDFVAKNDQFIALTKDTTTHIQNNGLQTVEELYLSTIKGVQFEEYLKSQIATIGENLVVRRFATLKAGENGVVNGYIHTNGRVGVIIGATCDNAEMALKSRDFLKQLCMHIAAMKPSYLSYEDLDMAFIENEYKALVAELEKENEERRRLKDPNKPEHKIPQFASRKQLNDEILKKAQDAIKEELKAQGKPEKIWDNIIPGKMNSFIAENSQLDSKLTLMGQFYVMDDKKTVEQVISQKEQEWGGKIKIVDFIRFEVGEGLEKKTEDFAAEVAAQL
ncbi:translation elongation factor Ts [Campylobacter sp. VicNov18]|uniref:translation elongation factor Ts n=1 Tax=Campylobacter bilis TaxID=2691918 RepID=UPI00130EDE95|nr:translation elongation factor Ts [Campylobacter bilis]MPV63189.1 elongation factor Ts [Campylobacter hepaticus]MBM0636689.1 elongation factor Ts [Campylobacter bilis]MCC8277533.1 translation elongation factor Ts [Campylobacter bilis]MCC8298738.1 translation elongation factor Ts [Campylobacter bilis]MCC8300442.1 translation elongation factor Ts [Campylobacter bilis]